MTPGSEPASGSVRPKQPTHSPVRSFGRYFCRCSSEPKAWIGYITSDDCTEKARAVAAIDALDLAGDQAVADVVDAGAAVAVERGAEEAQLAASRS